MRIGLYDVDSKRYPNLALMKISDYHKTQGDSIEWWFGIKEYDKVYISKVFDDTYSYWYDPLIRAEKVQFGGTGFVSPDGGVMKTRFHFNDFGGNNEIEPEKGITTRNRAYETGLVYLSRINKRYCFWIFNTWLSTDVRILYCSE